VIDNLLANARVHTPPRTPVRLAIATEANEAVMTVSDEGPGISVEDRERVFERFWRADPARVRSRGGSGLGLSIVASLVQSHGGTVSVESEPGQGAAFIVRLPLATDEIGVGS
jgi:two-component system, OmpR family, sensor kinase